MYLFPSAYTGMEKETDAIWAKVNAEVACARHGKSRVEIEARTLTLMNEQLKHEMRLPAGRRNRAAEAQHRCAEVADNAVRDTDSTKQAEAQGKAAAEAHRKAAEAAEAEWQKTVDRIDQTFHDYFVSGCLKRQG